MEQNGAEQPLLSAAADAPQLHHSVSSFTADETDIKPINTPRDFFREFYVETKKLWYLAGPAIFMSICQYSLGAITQLFAGHVSTIALAAVAVENSVIAAFAMGAMLGMGCALETLCGQAFGAGRVDKLGVYMQRSWVILNCTAILLMFLYIFATPILKLIGQEAEIAEAAGTLAIYMIPQLFAYAFNFPMAKFLQAQSKVMAMAVISGIVLILHTWLSWLLMIKLGWGLVGAAIALNTSWFLIVVSQIAYILSGTCGQAWSGFSWGAFRNLWGFVQLSLASAVMLCLETWYYMTLILFAGYLKNAEIAVDALSICMNIVGWTVMLAIGFNAAISVRVSNELGAARPRTAKFSVVVVALQSTLIGLVLSLALILTRSQFPSLFTESSEVESLVDKLTPTLVVCIIINNLQPILSGVAIGAGWQAFVAYVNIACYYLFGMPMGLLLGYTLGYGVQGIWIGMIAGTFVQTFVLVLMIYRTNWNKEASIATDRIKKWGGEVADNPNQRDVENFISVPKKNSVPN
uniref:Protein DETOXIFICATION n=1 Tax=Kalanchoe fedtschenkoi TaxID=63787 RepID=A0A7N0V994_KALFE